MKKTPLSTLSWLEKWKQERQKTASLLSREYMRYGLGIGVSFPERFLERAILKEAQSTSSSFFSRAIPVFPINEICKDEKIEKIIKKILLRSTAHLDKNFYYAQAAGAMSLARIIVCSGKTDTVTINTSLSGNNSDAVFIIARNNAELFINDVVKCSEKSANTRLVFCFADGGSRIIYDAKTRGMGSVSGFLFCVIENNSSIVCKDAHDGIFSQYYRGCVLSKTGASFTSSLSLEAKNGTHDYSYEAVHEASQTSSFIQAVGTADNDSRIIFRALTKAGAYITKSNGHQNARFITLSKNAEIDAIPSLEIASDDMQTSHALSVSYFDDSALWYPQTRGLSKKEARALLKDGLFTPVEVKLP